ncbi:hypothetical protein PspLS_06549 [Pyricularia sp. CBS 133598]|nr:hypothetical protein PspLS_06549 [Pyricularia sp. CBS 133598]
MGSWQQTHASCRRATRMCRNGGGTCQQPTSVNERGRKKKVMGKIPSFHFSRGLPHARLQYSFFVDDIDHDSILH